MNFLQGLSAALLLIKLKNVSMMPAADSTYQTPLTPIPIMRQGPPDQDLVNLGTLGLMGFSGLEEFDDRRGAAGPRPSKFLFVHCNDM